MNQIESRVPNIRFPEFAGFWKHVRLNELLVESKARNTSLNYSKDNVLSVSGEFGIVNQIQLLGRSYAGVSVHNYHVVEVGDIVYTKSPLKSNPYGIIKLNSGEPGIVSTLYAVYKVKQENAYGLFLDHYFSLEENTNRYLRPLVKKGAKNDMKINNAYVLHDRIFVPDILEQKKIADFLSAIDSKLQALKKKKALLEEYKKGVMQRIFSRELRFKDDDGGDFGEWEKKKYGEIFSFRTTNSYSREFLNYDAGLVKNIHYGDIHIKFSTLFDVAKENVPFINLDIDLNKIVQDNYCKEGDLIIADASEDYADVGKCIEIVNLNQEKVLAGLHTILARPDKYKMSIGFSGYLMQSEFARLQIKTIAQGSKVLSISATRLADIDLLIPAIPEQIKITNFLTAIDGKIKNTQLQIAGMEVYKKGLLQGMFV